MLGLVFFLGAEITHNFRINQENSHIQFAGENTIITSQSNVYAVFCKKQNDAGILELAISHDNGTNFSYYTIDTLFTQEPVEIKTVLPQLKKHYNSSIFIVYNKVDTEGKLVLNKVLFNTSLLTFTKSVISDDITSAPALSKNPGDFDVYYSTSFSENVSNYNFFMDKMKTDLPEQDDCMFWGGDEFFGKIHSNDNIYIRNNFPPLFHDYVTAHNQILFDSTEPAILNDTNVFMDGAEEYNPKKHLSGSADELRSIATTPFDPTADIVYVKINGSNYQSMYAQITESQVQIPVYSWYPADDDQARDIINNGGNWYEDANVIWTNTVTKYDTTWTPGPSGTSENNQFWLESTLWIEGTITGMQTWGSSEDVYITSDILYTDTPVGNTPDGFNPQMNDYTDPVNTNDYFGLVTEGSIYIKYKHRDPFQNNILRDDNCSDIHLYGCYAAIGYGDTEEGPDSWRNVSKLTYEYKYPHIGLKDFASISPYTLNDTTYSDVVYHRYITDDPSEVPDNLKMYCIRKPTDHVQYPLLSTIANVRTLNPSYHNSYPNTNPENTPPMIAFDLPGYNPAGPELVSDLATERGDINLYGSLAIRRMSYIHISGADPDRHEDAEWNSETCKYGALTWSAGYGRNLFADARLENIDLPGIPKVYNMDFRRASLEFPASQSEYYVESDISTQTSKNCYFVNDGTISALFSQRSEGNSNSGILDVLISTSGNSNFQYENINLNSNDLVLKDVETDNGELYLHFYNTSQEYNTIYIYDYNDNRLTETCQFASDFDESDIGFLNDGNVVIAVSECSNDSQIVFYDEADPATALMYWNPAFIDDSSVSPVSAINLNITANDNVQIAVQTNEESNWGNLYIGQGVMNTIASHEDVNPSDKFSIRNFPNPFNPETTISFTIPEDDNVKITIYNLKGQKVKTLLNEDLKKGTHSVKWDGTDSQNKNVCSGVYLYKLKTNNKTQSLNKCLLLK